MQIALSYKSKANLCIVSRSTSILEQLRVGDKAAQKQFYTDNFDRLVRIPLRYLRNQNDAIAALNDAFVKIFASIDQIDNDIKVDQWSAAIVRNTAIDHVRKQVKYDRRYVEISDFTEPTVELNAAMQSLTMQDIMGYIYELSDKERVVFCMYAIDGFKHREIAELLAMTVNTSKWYLSQARQKLQVLLKSYRP